MFYLFSLFFASINITRLITFKENHWKNMLYTPMLPNTGGDPKPKLLDWLFIEGLPNPAEGEAPNPVFETPKLVLVVLKQY